MALAKLGVVVLDCSDPRALAGFYAQVLGGSVEEDPGDSSWVGPEGAGRSGARLPAGARRSSRRGGRRRTARSSSTWTWWWRIWTRPRRRC